jgi:hypothetical protein
VAASSKVTEYVVQLVDIWGQNHESFHINYKVLLSYLDHLLKFFVVKHTSSKLKYVSH